jgi:hypothetical protein
MKPILWPLGAAVLFAPGANSINDVRQIVSISKFKDFDMRAFLLSPVKK